ncbi:MAG: RNA polymerase sigma factor [Leptolyngbyaceae cyanobacterium]
MSYKFKVRFNSEFKNIEEFNAWIKDSLARHEVNEKYTLDLIISCISQDCNVFQAASQASDVEVALLKTTFLEIIDYIKRNSRSDKERNRRKFDQAIQSLFDGSNENASNFFASITRQLYQFGLGRTYDAKEIIAEAYARGVKSINSGNNIHNPLGWVRRTALYVIREFKREQQRADNPKIVRLPWSPGGIVFSELMLEEDFLTVQTAVQQLSTEEQEILSQRIIEDLSWKEIGQNLLDSEGNPLKEGTARQRGARSLNKLRQLYEDLREDIQMPNDLDFSEPDAADGA